MIETERYQSIDGKLYIDVGNTRVKSAIFTGDHWEILFSGKMQDTVSFNDFCRALPDNINEIRIASVISDFIENRRPLFYGKTIRQVTVSGINPRYLDYHTIDTLGIDRFLACLGACHHSREAVVVVDAGTACTIDFMDQNRVFHGGYISPGLSVREKGLREYASSLPEVPRELPELWPGKSTREAIQWGVTGGFINEIRAAIQNYKRQFGDLQVWLTGGDAEIIDRFMPIPCQRNEHLVFEGMRVYPSVER